MILERYQCGFKTVGQPGWHFGQYETPKKLAIWRPQNEGGSCWEDARHDGDMPTHIKCTVFRYSPNGIEGVLEIAKLEHLRTVNGGIRYRASNKDRVSGGINYASHTYTVLIHSPGHDLHDVIIGPGIRDVIIAVSHGGGIHLYNIRGCLNIDTFPSMIQKIDDGEFFDLCDTIVKGYEHGREHGHTCTSREWAQAYVDNRLKRRTRRGVTTVEVLPKIIKEEVRLGNSTVVDSAV